MKLSCSAYQAGSSYAQKILTGHTQNYGATSSTTTNTSGESTAGLKMPTWQVEEIEGKGSPNDNSDSPVEGTSRREHGGHGGHGGGGGGSSRDHDGGTSSRRTSGGSSQSDPHGHDRHSDSSKTHDSSRSPSDSPANRLESRSRSKSVGEQQWTNLRAVMAWYARLRRIKRTKSNQRWMKLRTTVQLSGAIQTIQKKAPLKREDSFLKRFSTRQVIEDQFNGSQTEDLQGTRFCLETFEVGEDDGVGGLGGGQKVRRKKKPSLPRSVVNPDGNFYFYWLMILTLCVLYNLWTLIVRESFPELQADGQLVYWILADAFSDLIFLLDIAVQFRTGYLEQGLMVYKTKKLAKHYMSSRPFCLDLVSLTPTDLAQFYFGIHPMFRVPRFMKIYRIYKYYYMVESRTVYPNIWRVVNLIHILLLLAHWFACFYYLLSEAEGFEGHWVYPNPEIHSAFNSVTRKYLGSLYWSTLTLTTIGDLPTPYSNWQLGNKQTPFNPKANVIFRNHTHSRLHYIGSNTTYLFTIVSYLIGVFTFATIVGQVGNVITNRNANRLEFERLLDGAKMYMRHHKVPRDMQRRVLRWYDYSWSRGRIQGGGDINTALGLLPDKLKTELALHVNLSVLKKVTIFQECQPEFLHDLVLKMKAYIFTPGDLICRKGEVAREMFIIADGILEVISEAGRVLTTMQAGDFFGEIGILNLDGLNKRTADVRSVGYSELFSLSREDVLAAMKDYPEAQEILQTLGRKRLMEARKAAGPPAMKKHTSEKKSSPLHLLGHSMRKGSDDSPGGGGGGGGEKAGKRIVEKLRSDVKGLRNAIRKSRKSNSSKEDSSEQESSSKDVAGLRKQSSVSMHPYYFSSVGMDGRAASIAGGVLPMRSLASSVSRGVLKRMHHVVLSDEKERGGGSPPPSSSMATLSPLKMPKRVSVQTPGQEIVYPGPGSTSATGSGGSAGSASGFALMKRARAGMKLTSPPPSTSTSHPPEEREVIGAGLPLIYRLRLLKQKEEREAAAAAASSEETRRLLRSGKDDGEGQGPQQHVYTKVSVETQRDAPSSTANTFSEPLFPGGNSRVPLPMTPPSPALLLGSHTRQQSQSITSEPSNESVSPLAIPNIDEEIEPRTSSFSERRRPLALGLQKNTKTYGSIDDLSPEFSRLPFIKKLKILNERQKIAELLTSQSSAAVLTRSTSEGSSGIPHTVSPDGDSEMMHSLLHGRRTQSSSDGRKNLLQTQLKPEKPKFLPLISSSSSSSSPSSESEEKARSSTKKSDQQPSSSASTQISSSSMESNVTVIDATARSPLSEESSMSPPYSPECNETPERMRLKSILKRLAQSEAAATAATDSGETSYSADVEDAGSKDEQKGGGKTSSTSREKSQPLVRSKAERELLRAPTFEGYAARHRKFAKNVTFQRQAVCSPDEEHAQQHPSDATTSAAAIATTRPGAKKTKGDGGEEESTKGEDGEQFQSITPLTSEALKSKLSSLIFMTSDNNGGEGNKSGLESLGLNLGLGVAQEECISGIFYGIKAIIHAKLEEMQCRFQDRFVILETEVRRRDEIISLLQHRIQELEEKSMIGYYKGDKFYPYANGAGGQVGDGNEEDDDEEEIVHLSREGHPPNYMLHHQSSYLFSRGDSIDTVISNQDFDDDVFLMCDEESATMTQGDYQRLYNAPHHSGTAMESYEMTEVHSASSPAEEIPMWQLEFHRDSMSMSASAPPPTSKVPPPSPVDMADGSRAGQSESVAVEIGNTSTEYEESSDSEPEDGRRPSRVLKEHKISLEDDSSSDEEAKRARAKKEKDEEEGEEEETDSDEDEEVEGLDNKNWEVQLLIKEMEKQEAKKQQSVIMEEEEDLSNIGEMRMLEDEMREIREAVSSGALSPTELDMLDSVIQMRSERVKELWKTYSTESEGGCRHATSFSPKSRKVGRSVEDFRAGGGDTSSAAALRRGNSVRRALKRSEDEMGTGEGSSRTGGARSSKMIRRQTSLCEPAKAYDPASSGGARSRRRESADSLGKFPPETAKSIFSKFRLMRTLSKTFHLSPSSESFEAGTKSKQQQYSDPEAPPTTTSSPGPTSSIPASGSGFLPMISSVFSSALHSKSTPTSVTSIPMTSTTPGIFTIPSTSVSTTTTTIQTTEMTSPPATASTSSMATTSATASSSASSRPQSLGESQPLLKK